MTERKTTTRKKAAVAKLGTATDAMSLIERALAADVDVDKLEKLMDLAERQSREVARQQWHQAMAQFQEACPAIPKTRSAGNYKYAPLDTIMLHIRQPLAEAGLSVVFDETVNDGLRHTTCRVVHVGGHSESATFSGPAEVELRGNANHLQQSGAAQSYGRRYALIMALNLTTADEESDAVAETRRTITAEQAQTLDALIDEVGADRAKFLKYVQVEELTDMPARWYDRAVKLLESKRK